jgi:hypothetical protein
MNMAEMWGRATRQRCTRWRSPLRNNTITTFWLRTGVLTVSLSSRENPFTSFLTEQQIGSISALSIVCSASSEKYCAAKLDPLDKKDFSHRIVVIGQEASDDRHPLIFGEVSGAVLLANYIESLLDDRYFRHAPWPWTLLLSLLWLATIEIAFEKLSLPAAYMTCAAAIATGWVVEAFSILYFGVYIVLLLPGVVLFAYKTLEKLKQRYKERQDNRPKPPAARSKAVEAAG